MSKKQELELSNKPTYSFNFIRIDPHISKTSKVSRIVKENLSCEKFCFHLWDPIPISYPTVYAIDDYCDYTRHSYDTQRKWLRDPILRYKGEEECIIWSQQQKFKTYAKEIFNQQWDGATFWYKLKCGRTASISVAKQEYPLQDEFIDRSYISAYQAFKEAFRVFTEEKNIVCRPHLDLEKLSYREVQVLRLTADGLTACEIADILFVTTSTVNFHIKRITKKLRCRNKAQAVAKAILTSII